MLACSEGSKLALGMKYLLGWQTEIDNKKAFQIFDQIHQKNQIKDTNEEKDITEEKELSYSLFLLGRCYANGHGFSSSFISSF